MKTVNAGSVQPIEDVRDRIESDLKLDHAMSLSYELSKQLDDALGDGMTLEEAAESLAVPLSKADAVDVTGAGLDGVAIADLPADRIFLNTAFDSPLDETSFLIEGDNDSFFVLRVDGVTETRLPSLDEVKSAVTADWIAERRQEATEKKAATLAQEIGAQDDLAALAEKEGLVRIDIVNLNRTGRADDNKALPGDLAKSVFDLTVGSIAHGTSPSGAMIARLEKVSPASEIINDEGKAQIAQRLALSTTTGLIEQLSVALRNRHSIEITPGAVEYVIDPTAYSQATN